MISVAALLTRDEIVRGCMNVGWSRERAEAAADLELSRRGKTASAPPLLTTTALDDAWAIATQISFPLTFVLPWSALVSDNRKYSPSKRRQSDGGEHGILLLRPEYRQAKAKARSIAKDALPIGAAPAAVPLSLIARVFVPDDRRHDVVNFAKCVQDALTGVVYVDDCWLYANHWIRAGVDVDRPRAEITITPFED